MQLKRTPQRDGEQATGAPRADGSPAKMPRSWVGLVALIVLALGLAAFGMSLLNKPEDKKSEHARGEKKIAPVTVALAVAQDVPVQVKAIGNVEPITTVQVKSQVTGQIQTVFFKEGEFVKKGDPLFLIDPRGYEAQVEQADANVAKDLAQVKQAQAVVAKDQAQLAQNQANLDRDVAQKSFAETEVGRYGSLVEVGAVSKEQYDQMNTNHRSQSATVAADEAAINNVKAMIDVDKAAVDNARALARADQAVLNNARVQLGYCHIISPVDGVTGALINHLGDMIKANDTNALVVINQVSPIYVSFSVPEQEFGAIRSFKKDHKLDVLARLRGGKIDKSGDLTFYDNAVDTTTGTIRLKSTFKNQDRELWPGQFVDVSLTLDTNKAAVLIPSQAVQASQKGPYVFRVKSDKTAEMQPIVTETTYNGFAVIKEGVKAGDTIVTDGQLQVVPGAPVVIRKPTSEQ